MKANDLYSFTFRGQLAEEAVSHTLGRSPTTVDEDIRKALSFDVLNAEVIARRQIMALVYIAISAFETTVRKLVTDIMIEGLGEGWWTAVSERIRKKVEARMDEESRFKWHSTRGGDPIEYTDFGDLVSILKSSWHLFEPHLRSAEWAENIIRTLERSRNVIMHSGNLDIQDIERVGIHIRDWIRQVGG